MRRSPLNARAIIVLVSIYVVLGGFCGCSCDEEIGAPAEIPESSPEFSRGTPLGCWHLMDRALADQDSTNWIRVASSGFTYVADPVALAKYPDEFGDWDYEAEQVFISRLFASGSELGVNLISNDFEAPDASGTEVSWAGVEYSIVVSGEDWTNPVVYSGLANLEFRIEGALWYLLTWQDVVGAEASWDSGVVLPTMGELRGQYGGE